MSKKTKKTKETPTVTIYNHTFLVIKPYHKKGERLISNWETMEGCSIDDLYKKPSCYKENAWRDCQNMCNTFDGTGLRCGCANAMAFSAAFWAFIPKIQDKALIYRTKNYDYIVGYFD